VGGGSLTTALSLNFIDNTTLPTCAAEAVRDATQPIDSCILFDAGTSEDDCFIRAPTNRRPPKSRPDRRNSSIDKPTHE
jgi:hypothetical protein